ncbi:MAG: translation initiation factor IF-2, partial [Crocinitomicaceae bacterium]
MAGKPIRLGKAAGELNVGIPTIVEFLGSKGIVIDSSPTARLEQEHFDILCQEFAADQNMKEQSKAALRREKRESLSIKDKPQEETVAQPVQEDEDEEDINLEEIKRQVLSDTPAAPAPVVAAPVEPVAAEPEVASENKVNVIGKIDLDAINQRTRPDKKK